MDTQALIHQWLGELASREGASDLLITTNRPPQLRVFKKIISLEGPKLSSEDTKKLCLALLSEEQKQRFQSEKELDFSYGLDDVGRFRINLFLQRGAIGMVVRNIWTKIPTFDQINAPENLRILADIEQGLVLFTGPTGTGKSTSVAAVINHINHTRSCHIVTIEDPIEYMYAHAQATIDQREIGTDTHSFAEALRRVLRQSPDVIAIGEIRDQTSAQVAVSLADTGHLTLATLHTRGAVEAISRLIELFPSDQRDQAIAQLSSSLQAVVWQQLIPQANQEGLILACEILRTPPGVQALIRTGRLHEIHNLMQAGRKHGMCTMEQAVAELAQKGLINLKPGPINKSTFKIPSEQGVA